MYNDEGDDMRVISGIYKGKNLLGFDIKGTRPTMDRVKESIFGMIQNKVNNSVCLDLFAGSGSLGIEALSNGAKVCYFVDNNKESIQVLKKNTDSIKNAKIIYKDYKNALDNFFESSFDLIFLDPPYDLNLITPSIQKIIEKNLLKDDGYLICEYETEEICCPYELIKEKKYGNKMIQIYKK